MKNQKDLDLLYAAIYDMKVIETYKISPDVHVVFRDNEKEIRYAIFQGRLSVSYHVNNHFISYINSVKELNALMASKQNKPADDMKT